MTKHQDSISFDMKKSAVVDLCSRSGAARDVTEVHGTNRDTLYRWKYELLGKEAMPVRYDGDRALPDDMEALEALNEAKGEVKDLRLPDIQLRMEKDILEATVEM